MTAARAPIPISGVDASLLPRSIPRVDGGGQEWHFVFSPVDPDPSWRADLNSFAVFKFENGEPIDPDGTEEHPFHFAVNSAMSGRLQVETVAASLLATLRRQKAVASFQAAGGLTDLPAQVAAADQTSREESSSLSALLLAGETDAVANLLALYGRTLRFSWRPHWVDDHASFAARLPFLARAYNEIESVKDAVDRVVSATVGSGGRMSSASEMARREAERMSIQGMIWRYMSHSIRDAELAGLGAVSMSVNGVSPRIRLVRPSLVRVGRERADVEEWDEREKRWEPVPNAFYLPGAAQRAGGFPLSALEPMIPSIRTYFVMKSVVDEISRFEASGDDRAALLSEQRAVAEGLLGVGLQGLADMLKPVMDVFPSPRPGLYFRGYETWRP